MVGRDVLLKCEELLDKCFLAEDSGAGRSWKAEASVDPHGATPSELELERSDPSKDSPPAEEFRICCEERATGLIAERALRLAGVEFRSFSLSNYVQRWGIKESRTLTINAAQDRLMEKIQSAIGFVPEATEDFRWQKFANSSVLEVFDHFTDPKQMEAYPGGQLSRIAELTPAKIEHLTEHLRIRLHDKFRSCGTPWARPCSSDPRAETCANSIVDYVIRKIAAYKKNPGLVAFKDPDVRRLDGFCKMVKDSLNAALAEEASEVVKPLRHLVSRSNTKGPLR